MAVVPGTAPLCECPICRFGRAHADASRAVDAIIESTEEKLMELAYLRGEIRRALDARDDSAWAIIKDAAQVVGI